MINRKVGVEPRCVNSGVPVATETGRQSKLVLPSHKSGPLSNAAVAAWRFQARSLSGNGSVADARRCSGFACAAIADSVIAAPLAACKPGAPNSVVLIAATNAVRKENWTIATAKTGSAAGERKPA